jgi:hypoxanthine phosphoribosyltransferase
MDEFYIATWDEIEESIFNIAIRMIEEDFIPDAIVAILTGGLIPAKLISDLLDVKIIRYVEIKFYKGVRTTETQPLLKGIYIDSLERKKVLIVDDVADTGTTLDVVEKLVRFFNPNEVKTATLYVKPWSKKYPKYYNLIVDKWIIFPWDKWEVVRERPEAPVDKKDRFFELMKRIKRQ